MITATTPHFVTPMLPFSPARALTLVTYHEPAVFVGGGARWAGPFPFETALSLLFYGLVAIHYHRNVAQVVVTRRGESFARNGWDDAEIADACRRLRWEAQGSMVVS